MNRLRIADCRLQIAELTKPLCVTSAENSAQLCGEYTLAVRRIAVVLSLLLSLSAFLIAQTTPPARKKNPPPAPTVEVALAEAAKLEAIITTELGVIRMELFPDKAPKHVLAFIKNIRAVQSIGWLSRELQK